MARSHRGENKLTSELKSAHKRILLAQQKENHLVAFNSQHGLGQILFPRTVSCDNLVLEGKRIQYYG